MARQATSSAQADQERVRTFGRLLQRTEWLPLESLLAHQAPLVVRLLVHARKTTRFYRDRLDLDLRSPECIREGWSRIPILTRGEAVKSRLALMSRKTPPDVGAVIAGETSGSTGAPFSFRKNAASTLYSLALMERQYRWWNVDGAKSLALIAPDRANKARPPEGLTTRGWHSDHPEGLRHAIGLEADVETHLSWLVARRPHYLATYPPILEELARSAQRRGIELRLELLMSFANVLDEATRELCRKVFGAEIADTYGAQETDQVAAQCRECGEYHIGMETVHVEVLGPGGAPVGPGDIGRVVVTPLYNYAMPLIRYELGDMAEVGVSPSACGRELPTLRRIMGRYRNMFRFRDGSVIWPIAVRFRLPDLIALEQFQVVQTDLDAIEIRYVPDQAAADRPVDLSALTERVRSVLRQPVEVSVRRVARIARSRGGKFEDCVSLVPADGGSVAGAPEPGDEPLVQREGLPP